ncbi:hypothetical protein [Rhodoblastus acidophilus]|uniref:hypothetical protein n=1 Tax=Rhodoblastus acidophilus TaxID=1074 RepID=UPI001FCF1B2D|nr:hypothetical protein [Rhodoblastus acidophilus]
MFNANKFSDTSYLIDIFLSGGTQALDAMRDKLQGRIVLSSQVFYELERFTTSNIGGLLNWVQNSANATIINYTPSALADAERALAAGISSGASNLQQLLQDVKTARDNAGEASILELLTGKKVTIVGGQITIQTSSPLALAQTAMQDAGISGTSVLFMDDNAAIQALKNSTTKATGFAKYGLDVAPITSARFYNNILLGLDDSEATKTLIKNANEILRTGRTIGIGLNKIEYPVLSTDAKIDASNIAAATKAGAKNVPWWKLASYGMVGAVIAKSGIISNVIGAVITSAQAEELRAAGNTQEANKLWIKFLFETSGGVAGGVLGAAAAELALKGQGGSYNIAAAILASIAGATVGSSFGAQAGDIVYNNYQVFIDHYINPIYDTLSSINTDDPDVIANALATLIGLDITAEYGSAASDFLFGTKWVRRNGLQGNDVLLGWNADYVSVGGPVDKADPQSLTTPVELQMILDGGQDNDIVIALGGKKAITSGGTGRDLIYNTSQNGIIWGDVANSILDKVIDQRFYYDSTGTKTYIQDNKENADNFVWASGTTIEDPQFYDILTFFGIPLTNPVDNGGALLSLAGFGLGGMVFGASQIYKKPIDTLYCDEILPFITYSFKKQDDGSYDLLVSNVLTSFLDALDALAGGNSSSGAGGLSAALKNHQGYQTIKDYIPAKAKGDVPAVYSWIENQYLATNSMAGKLGMVFKKTNPIDALLAMLPPTLISMALSEGGPLIEETMTLATSVVRMAKALRWYVGGDPLVLDLSGDGMATLALEQSSVHFDVNNDFFSERTGWLAGSDEGFLTYDKNGNGAVDDATELFGTFANSGFADLGQYDVNKDGVIDASDAIFNKLKVWIDANDDGVSQADELKSLSDLGIISISLKATDLDGQDAGGATLRAASIFTYADGRKGTVYETIFQTDQTSTIYRGESGQPAWASTTPIDAKGFGRVTRLAIATANDPDLAALVNSRAAAMTTPDLRTLVNQASDVLGLWGETLNLTRELTPVLLRTAANGAAVLLDRAIYVEDAQGGYWTLASGAPVRAADGSAIARATLQDVLAQATTSGAQWRLEQMWSPTTRDAAVKFRADAPYLVSIENGRAVVKDYGVQNADGSWRLAAGERNCDRGRLRRRDRPADCRRYSRTRPCDRNGMARRKHWLQCARRRQGRKDRPRHRQRRGRRLHGADRRQGRNLLRLGAQPGPRSGAAGQAGRRPRLQPAQLRDRFRQDPKRGRFHRRQRQSHRGDDPGGAQFRAPARQHSVPARDSVRQHQRGDGRRLLFHKPIWRLQPERVELCVGSRQDHRPARLGV